MRVNSFPKTVIEIVPPTGESFILAGGRNQRAFILPDTVSGFETPVEHTYRDSVTSYGDRSVGWKIPAVESSFEFYLRDAADVADVYRRFRRAFRSGSQIVFRSPAGVFYSRIEVPVFTDANRELSTRRSFQGEVSFRRPDGCWLGETEYFTGNATVMVDGDEPLAQSMRLHWTGEASSVTFPDGRKVTFPELGAERYINLDFGMAAQVTRPDGTVDTNAWSGINGAVHGMTLAPNEPTEWVLGAGMTLEVTPRYLSPWR